MTFYEQVERDIWRWINEFIAVPNAFYHNKFAPCPYARSAVTEGSADVVAWRDEELRGFIRAQAIAMRDSTTIGTRVMAFPPRIQRVWGLIDYIDELNLELGPDNVFLNAGVAKTSISAYPGSSGKPYFIVVANTLDAVLKGAKALQRTPFYKAWPVEQYRTVVERRARLAASFRADDAMVPADELARGRGG